MPAPIGPDQGVATEVAEDSLDPAVFSSDSGVKADPLAAAKVVATAVIVATLLMFANLLPALYGLWGIVASQIFVILVPTVSYAFLSSTQPIRVLSLARPSLRALAGGGLTGLGMCLMASAIFVWQQRVLPLSSQEIQALEVMSRALRATPLLGYLAMVVAPAVCEELLFRGVLLTQFRQRLSNRHAVLVCGAVFGIVHGSMKRLIAQGMLGVLCAAAVVESGSVWVGITIHATYNLGILQFGRLLESAGPTSIFVCGGVLIGVGMPQVRAMARNS